MKTLLRVFSILLVCVLLVSACDKKDKPRDPRWSEYIGEHSAGTVSRRSEIRLRFVNDLVSEERIGQDASDAVTVSPKIAGRILYNGRREIVIRPDQDLKPGGRYLVRVHAKKVGGVPDDLGDYEFSVSVIAQSFEVNVAGLVTDPADTKRQSLLGSLVTADVEDADGVEKVLSAELNGKELAVSWLHGIDGRTHEFRIDDIRRGDAAGELLLIWDGDPINVNNEGRTAIEVPAAGDFMVTRAEAVKGDRQYVQVVFSDRLDPAQSLEGLIRLDQGKFSLRVEGNLVKLYPDSAAQGTYKVTVEPGVRNESGARIQKSAQYEVFFEAQKPQVRFTGSGVILPENQFLSIPFEAINARSVQVTAFRVFESNVGQFLQTNRLDGGEELGRVGRFLWRKTIDLGKVEGNKWNRFSLDATRLLNEHPGGLFRLTLSINRGNAILSCTDAENAVPVDKEAPPADNEDLYVTDSSGWDYVDEYYGEYVHVDWRERNNPCNDAYYRYSSDVRDSRNFIASNIGLIAKQDGRDTLRVVTTNLQTSRPESGVNVEVRNFQDQVIGSAASDSEGFAEVGIQGAPFYVIAQKGGQKGYLKTNAATALPVSHFDVGGDSVKAGIKGHIYGERGVWRPGDDIHLTFVLEDKENLIPEGHPVSMQLYNPQGQLMQALVNSSPVGDFYAFTLKTDGNAPTGNWNVKAILGGSSFEKKLKIETVIPNRLKVELDFGKEQLRQSEMPAQATLFGQWLHGATAANLRADVAVDFATVPTVFTRAADFVFDDPARRFESEPETVFEGQLDARGYATFSGGIWPRGSAPGMLKANFTSRVFEEGGAFSTSRTSLTYHPYDTYVGIKLPKGDAVRGMLLTDIKHPVEIATLNAQGEPVAADRVQVTVYKIDWKWWWDRSGDSLAHYATATYHNRIQHGEVSTVDGRGVWELEVKAPDWGRYLIRACDLDGEHCSGKVFYMDWPGWAERAQEEGGVGANVLTLLPESNEYDVGATARVRLPEAAQGRALVSIENGSHVLQQRWIEFGKDAAEFDFAVTRDMSPNVYVNVTLIQPHQDRDNDRPIRLYGVVPIRVNDPATRLAPQLKAADEWTPSSRVELEVSEAQGRAMTYTVALVDEGLLGLTGFKTPDLHAHFYRKEALGVLTWDLFDQVAGAYGGELERLLALGGGEEGDALDAGQEQKRFPPVVRFIGPFKLAAGKTGKHAIDLPQYIGAVRVMVVAGENGAYGRTEKSVFVRDGLSLLPTVPRVLGPEEELTVPVSVFVMKDGIRQVKLAVETSRHFTVQDQMPQTLTFEGQGEQLALIRLKVLPELGKGRLKFSADGGGYHSESEIFIDIRTSNPRTLHQTTHVLKAGDDWETKIVPHGLPGTNKVMLEVSAVPPLNIERRLGYLIAYPHGCVEQITSTVFPQLYLSLLVKLDQRQQQEIQNNVQAGIERLRGFQAGNGAFLYWPGGWGGGVNDWATNYAGHFLVEASRLGYHVPSDMLTSWINYQTQAAQSRVTGAAESDLDQAYRLYTLALANKPDMGSMNRLRESGSLDSVSRWQLAAAYKLAGQTDAAADLVRGDNFRFRGYLSAGPTFGSVLRDQAIVLNGLVLLGDDRAKRIAEDVSNELYADKWHSTQSVAYALMAMAKFAGADGLDETVRFTYAAGGAMKEVRMEAPIYTVELADFPVAGAPVKLENESGRRLYVTILSSGVPGAGSETAAANGLRMEIGYTDKDGRALDVSSLAQGGDFIAVARVRNLTDRQIDNIALTHTMPSGWEIHNPRMSGDGEEAAPIDYQDIRDDRVLTYFGLKPLEERSFQVLLNATYLGRYYLPSAAVEAMYDASNHAHTRGQWIEVVKGAR